MIAVEAPLPTVGRMVHFVTYGTPGGEYSSVCRAAIVTEVEAAPAAVGGARVGLAVLNPTGLFFHPLSDGGCRQSETHRVGGTWHWPERV